MIVFQIIISLSLGIAIFIFSASQIHNIVLKQIVQLALPILSISICILVLLPELNVIHNFGQNDNHLNDESYLKVINLIQQLSLEQQIRLSNQLNMDNQNKNNGYYYCLVLLVSFFILQIYEKSTLDFTQFPQKQIQHQHSIKESPYLQPNGASIYMNTNQTLPGIYRSESFQQQKTLQKSSLGMSIGRNPTLTSGNLVDKLEIIGLSRVPSSFQMPNDMKHSFEQYSNPIATLGTARHKFIPYVNQSQLLAIPELTATHEKNSADNSQIDIKFVDTQEVSKSRDIVNMLILCLFIILVGLLIGYYDSVFTTSVLMLFVIEFVGIIYMANIQNQVNILSDLNILIYCTGTAQLLLIGAIWIGNYMVDWQISVVKSAIVGGVLQYANHFYYKHRLYLIENITYGIICAIGVGLIMIITYFIRGILNDQIQVDLFQVIKHKFGNGVTHQVIKAQEKLYLRDGLSKNCNQIKLRIEKSDLESQAQKPLIGSDKIQCEYLLKEYEQDLGSNELISEVEIMEDIGNDPSQLFQRLGFVEKSIVEFEEECFTIQFMCCYIYIRQLENDQKSIKIILKDTHKDFKRIKELSQNIKEIFLKYIIIK